MPREGWAVADALEIKKSLDFSDRLIYTCLKGRRGGCLSRFGPDFPLGTAVLREMGACGAARRNDITIHGSCRRAAGTDGKGGKQKSARFWGGRMGPGWPCRQKTALSCAEVKR